MKRLPFSIILGGVLGLLCIVGVGTRLGYEGNELFIFANWYNRVLMGVVIGLLPKTKSNVLIRGGVFGLLISLGFWLTSSLRDAMGFFAGIAYGVIIDYFATKYSD